MDSNARAMAGLRQSPQWAANGGDRGWYSTIVKRAVQFMGSMHTESRARPNGIEQQQLLLTVQVMPDHAMGHCFTKLSVLHASEQVPDGMGAGQQLGVRCLNGQQFTVIIPEGCVGGSIFQARSNSLHRIIDRSAEYESRVLIAC